MRPSRLLSGLAAVSVALLLGGCTGIFAAPDDDAPVSIVYFTVAVKGAVKPYYSQTLDWKPCGRKLTCASLRVPLDWLDVTSKSTSIALVKRAATGTRLGSLVVNPGGPGESGVDFVKASAEDAVDRAVGRSYDVIGFDPRGVGASGGVSCFTDSQMDTYLYSIDPGAIGSATWIAAEKRRARSLAAACEKNTGPLLAHIDTIDAAQDMDVIRAALGESKLNYLGYSYGTYLGTVYAGLHPKRVGRTVFDGALDPWSGDTGFGAFNGSASSAGMQFDFSGDGGVIQAKGFEDNLTAYLTSCLTGSLATVGQLNCPFSSSVRAARTKVIALLGSVGEHPLVAKDGRKLGAANLALAIETPLYNRADWPVLTRLFAQVEKGDATTAFRLTDEYNDRNPDGSYSDNADMANLAIGCLEEGPSVDLNYDKQQAIALKLAAPVLGPYDAYGDLQCSGWKYGPTTKLDPITASGSGPILIVGTTDDPATPYSEATDLTRQLANAHLVTYNGDGHTAYNQGDGCVDKAVDDYLLQGTVPSTDPDCS